jgi:hypothetical protein
LALTKARCLVPAAREEWQGPRGMAVGLAHTTTEAAGCRREALQARLGLGRRMWKGIIFLPRVHPHNNNVSPKENSVVPGLGLTIL